MDYIFGRRKSSAEMAKEYKRAIDKSVRSLDRERIKLETQEKITLFEVKRSAKLGQITAARSTAKQLVVIRAGIQRFNDLKTQMMSMCIKMQTLGTVNALTDAMKDLNRVIVKVNMKMNIPEMKKFTFDFTQQLDTLAIKEEMMNDTIDMAMDTEGADQNEDELVDQILDEINLNEMAVKVPTTKPKNVRPVIKNNIDKNKS